MQIRIQNKLNQTIEVPVKDEHGVVQSVRIAARMAHGPVDDSRLTKYAKRLVANGRIRIRRVA